MNIPEKRQSVRRDAIYVYSAYGLRYLSLLILVPYYGRILGPTTYGIVLAAMSLMALVWMSVNFGFSTTGARELAMSMEEGVGIRATIIARQLSARFILIPVGIAIGAAGTVLSESLRANPLFGVLATVLGLVNAMNLGWFYQGLCKFKLSLLFEAMAYPLNVIFVLALVKTPHDGAEALVAILAASSISCLVSYACAFRIARPSAFSLAEGFAEIKSAATIFVLAVNATAMTSGSTYLLSVFSTTTQVGYFGSVEKLISFALAFLQPAAQVLMPTIAQRSAQLEGNARDLIRQGIYWEVGYGLCACLIGVILSSTIISLAFGPAFADSVPMMRIMLLALPFAALTHALGFYVLLPKKNERLLVRAFIFGNLVNLVAVILLAKHFGGIGVSAARVAGECLTTIVLVGSANSLRKRAA